jgi:hypothetical protein
VIAVTRRAAPPPGPPDGAVVGGPSFSKVMKALATGLVLALAVWAVRALPTLRGAALPASAWAFIAGALAIIGACYVGMLFGRTEIDATHVRQRWLWRKQIAFADIAQVKFIFVPGLQWLIAPRLVVRARSGGVMVFHAAEPRVVEAFVALCGGPGRR